MGPLSNGVRVKMSSKARMTAPQLRLSREELGMRRQLQIRGKGTSSPLGKPGYPETPGVLSTSGRREQDYQCPPGEGLWLCRVLDKGSHRRPIPPRTSVQPQQDTPPL